MPVARSLRPVGGGRRLATFISWPRVAKKPQGVLRRVNTAARASFDPRAEPMPEEPRPRTAEAIEVLWIRSSGTSTGLIRRALGRPEAGREAWDGGFRLTRVDDLAGALELLGRRRFDVVLFGWDPTYGDAQTILADLCSAAGTVPVVTIVPCGDDWLTRAAIQRGAQDCLSADRVDGRLLRRALRHAIERKRAEVALRRRAEETEAAQAQLAQQAAEMQARAEQLDRVNHELDDFASIASHDLKEPLRGIAAYCETLLEDYEEKLDEDGRRRLRMLVKLCDRLETFVGDLLNYCRLGGARPVDGPVELEAVVEEVLDMLRPAIDRRHALVRVVHPLPTVTGDANLIGMALSNLIGNGLKFNDSAQPQVEVGCQATDPPTLYVKDNGIGIDPKFHEAVFTIFRRLHSREKYEGTGVGLTIVRKIVESHGGRIWFESVPGQGTTFHFTLAPAAAERPAVEAAPRPPHWVERSRLAKWEQESLSP